MNICMVLEGGYPTDVRVRKEAKALIKEGHKIFLLSLGKKGMPVIEDIDGIKVIRLFTSQKFLTQVSKFVWFSLFFEKRLWRRDLEKIIKEYKIDVIHVHDLPLVKTGLLVSHIFGIPLVADLHENYPEGAKIWGERITLEKMASKLLRPKWRWKKLERLCVQQSDKVITVVDEAKKHYVHDCGIPSKKVTVVRNVVDLDFFDKSEFDDLILSKYENNFIILYVGGIGPHRGIDIAIKAMPKVLNKISDAILLLVGGRVSKHKEELKSRYKEELKKLCENLNIKKSVVFEGWRDFNLVPSYIALSDVCLVPHYATEHTNTTIPHKLFQYMAMRKPVIVTDCKPLKRIVKESKCGIVIPSGDYMKMAESIIRLYEDNNYRKELGKNGRKAVEKQYNWKNEAKKLIELYNGLEKYEK